MGHEPEIHDQEDPNESSYLRAQAAYANIILPAAKNAFSENYSAAETVAACLKTAAHVYRMSVPGAPHERVESFTRYAEAIMTGIEKMSLGN